MKSPYRDKVAIVTGGASGIGRAIGRELARKEATVILADVNDELAKESAKAIGRESGKVRAVLLDVTDAAAVRKVVDETVNEQGRLDFIFNNAGIGLFGEVHDMNLDHWRRIIDVNLYGVLNGVAAAYPQMIEQGSGHIVNTASLAGLIPTPIATAYSTAKHAVVGLSLSLRGEAADLGVRVSVVCPGFINTPIKDSLTYLKLDKEKLIDGTRLKLHPPAYCAQVVLKGVARNKPIITVTAFAGLAWKFNRLLPSLHLWIARQYLRVIRKKYTSRGEK